jgi:hypothetical protein
LIFCRIPAARHNFFHPLKGFSLYITNIPTKDLSIEKGGIYVDALLLSRWQFAITTIYHFLFVPLTLGLTIWVALLETCYVRTQRPHWKEPCRQP